MRVGSPNAAVVCAGTWSAQGIAFDAIIQQDCAAIRGHYVPLSGLYGVAANRAPEGALTFYGTADGVAPNDAGHRAIANALLKAIGVAPA